ncbi:hypothetical protein BJH93_08510 [Kocuria polaris]|nr:hypothetical protein [Kocuria polaris]
MTFRYGRATRPSIDNLDWDVHPGSTVLLGPNGAGKSTLLMLLGGGLRPTTGSVSIEGSSGRQLVGYMPQNVAALRGLTAHQQVAYAGWLQGMRNSEAERRAAEALARVNLSSSADQQTKALSGGQLRRVGLAEVLVTGARLILLDEPTVGLDPAERSRFRTIMSDLRSDHSIVVSTHLVDDLDGLFDEVLVLQRGSVRFQGPLEDFMHLAPENEDRRRAEAAYLSLLPERTA